MLMVKVWLFSRAFFSVKSNKKYSLWNHKWNPHFDASNPLLFPLSTHPSTRRMRRPPKAPCIRPRSGPTSVRRPWRSARDRRCGAVIWTWQAQPSCNSVYTGAQLRHGNLTSFIDKYRCYQYFPIKTSNYNNASAKLKAHLHPLPLAIIYDQPQFAGDFSVAGAWPPTKNKDKKKVNGGFLEWGYPQMDRL